MNVEKPWLKNYPKGQNHTMDEIPFKNLIEFYKRTCTTHQNKVAFSSFGVELSFSETDWMSDEIAAWLQSVATTGAKIAVMSPNCLQYVVIVQAIHKAGMVAVNLNPMLSSRELSEILEDSLVDAIFIWNGSAHLLDKLECQHKPRSVVVMSIADYFPTIKQAIINFVLKKVKKIIPAYRLDRFQTFDLKTIHSKSASLELDGTAAADIRQDKLAFLQYTGGTTGKSKGVMLSHGNMLANLTQATQCLPAELKTHDEKLNIITALPLYHIFALTANYHVMFGLGIKNILITNPRDIPAFIKTLVNHPPHIITGVNTLFNALVHDSGITKVDFSHLKYALGGGMSVQKSTSDAWLKVTNTFILEAYGLSETAPAVSIMPHDTKSFTGSIGLPLPSTDVKLIDDDGKFVKLKESGELVVKGPQVMQGYWKNDAETKNAFTKDGWFRTGDIGYMDEGGYLFLLDRKKDMVVVSGFNVYPTEVEQIINEIDDVVECGCTGVVDEHSGEVIKAFITKKDKSTLTSDDVIAHCKERLSSYKVPRHVVFLDELPKTNVGKVLRRSLK